MALPLGQGLPGLTGSQPLGGPPLGTTAKSTGGAGYATMLGPEVTSWTVPATGTYQVTIWGGGGGSNFNGGGDGAGASRSTRRMIKGQVVTLSIAAPSSGGVADGDPTTATLPDGTVMTALGGARGAAHTLSTASGGDINVTGSFAAFTGSGADSAGAAGAGFTDMLGGASYGIANSAGRSPGGGGAYWSSQGSEGGSGLVIILRTDQ